MLGQVSSKGLRWGTDGDDGVGPSYHGMTITWCGGSLVLPRWLDEESCHLLHGGPHDAREVELRLSARLRPPR